MQSHIPSGKQTQITPQIQKLASSFSSSGLELIFDILRWINSEVKYKHLVPPEKDKIFRKRTAHEIIISRHSSGCTDFTLAFITLCRAKNILAKYLELLDLRWLRGEEDYPIQGHVIAEATISGKIYYIDATNCTVSTKLTSGKVIYASGLDSWDIGIDGENWKEVFIKYKKEFRKKTKDGGF